MVHSVMMCGELGGRKVVTGSKYVYRVILCRV